MPATEGTRCPSCNSELEPGANSCAQCGKDTRVVEKQFVSAMTRTDDARLYTAIELATQRKWEDTEGAKDANTEEEIGTREPGAKTAQVEGQNAIRRYKVSAAIWVLIVIAWEITYLLSEEKVAVSFLFVIPFLISSGMIFHYKKRLPQWYLDKSKKPNVKSIPTIRMHYKSVQDEERERQMQYTEANLTVKCPRCGSPQFIPQTRGYSLGWGLLGAIFTGALGLLAGAPGSSRVVEVRCRECGFVWKFDG